ncbi:MAG: hypothetical protein LBT52_04875, partial [Clostridiales Family XIII bacterium]|nr:hypothetical protein [Clostridiales Family XIII bacterium]
MSKRLLMGNEAIALGALRAGALVFTGYPGTPSTEILETVAREKPGGVYYEWSVNEKSAMEVAAGAAQSGARALVTMKQVGLNVASDPLMSLNYVGVKAGMVIVVADDPGPISSQTEQDTRHFGRFAKLCVFDPSTPEEAYLMAGEAFAWSERIGRPVILRPTTRICHSYATVEILPDLPRAIPEGFTKDGGRWAIFPRLSYANKIKIEETLKGIAEFEGNSADDFQGVIDSKSAGNLLIKGLDAGEGIEPGAKRYDIASGAKRYGIASGGVSWLYVREALAEITAASGASEVASSDRDVYKKDAARGSSPRHDSQGSDAAAAKLPNYDLLKIGAYPLPEKRCLDFLNGVDEVLVLEELDPFIEDELARLAGRYQIGVPIRGKRTGDIFNAGEGSTAFARADIERFLGLPAGQGKQENQGDSDQEEGAVRNQRIQDERGSQSIQSECGNQDIQAERGSQG